VHVCIYIHVTHVHKIFLFMCSNLCSIFNHFLERFQVKKLFSCAGIFGMLESKM
jgi:hypothetical protein